MKFKNLVTGNILIVNNAKTAALMRSQKDTYQEIEDKVEPPKTGKLSSKLTTAELEQIALAEGVDLADCTTNEQRRAAIELARENKTN